MHEMRLRKVYVQGAGRVTRHRCTVVTGDGEHVFRISTSTDVLNVKRVFARNGIRILINGTAA